MTRSSAAPHAAPSAAPPLTAAKSLPLQRQTLTGHDARRAPRAASSHGVYPEGEPLRQDAIAEELGVSRIPVREALRQLEAEGLVTFNPHRGAVVSTLSLDEIEELFELRADDRGATCCAAPMPHARPTTTLARAERGARRVRARRCATATSPRGGAQLAVPLDALRAGRAARSRWASSQKLHQQCDRYLRMQLALTHGETRANDEHRAHPRRRAQARRDGAPCSCCATTSSAPAARCAPSCETRRGIAAPRARAVTHVEHRSTPAAAQHFVGGAWRAGDVATRGSRRRQPVATRATSSPTCPRGAPPTWASPSTRPREALETWRACPARRAPSTCTGGRPRSPSGTRRSRRRWRARSASRSARRAARRRARVAILRYYAGEAVRAIGDVIPAQAPGALQYTLHEPLGVVGLITPWNFPVAIPLWKAAPALAFGNTVVLKPCRDRRRTSRRCSPRRRQAAGMPAGRVQRGARQRPRPSASALVGAPERARGQLHRLGRGRRAGGGGRGGAQHPLPDRDGRQERRDRAPRRRHRRRPPSLTAAGAMRYAGQKCTATSRVVVVARGGGRVPRRAARARSRRSR